MSLTQDIKEHALNLGYSKVGITTADSFVAYIQDLETRSDMYSFYINSPRQPIIASNPKKIFPTAKSIISVVYDYAKESFPKNLLGKIGRIYQARCYMAPAHHLNGARYELMKSYLEQAGCLVSRSEKQYPERLAAARAGVTTYGKNNFAYADGIGSFIMLSSFLVDVELEYDTPTIEVSCPDNCRLCIDACPTGAIYGSLKLNPRRCISYNNWYTNGRPGVSSYIPHDIREKIGTRVHGCDVCQEVCPRNRPRLKMSLPRNAYLEEIAQDFNLVKMLNMTDDFYATRVQPIMYNYLKEKKYFQRNAAIAMGNQGDPEFITALSQAMHDVEDVVRSYAAWALGKIGGGIARQILESSLHSETSDETRKEIEDALAMT